MYPQDIHLLFRKTRSSYYLKVYRGRKVLSSDHGLVRGFKIFVAFEFYRFRQRQTFEVCSTYRPKIDGADNKAHVSRDV